MSNNEPKFTYTKEEIRAATADMASTAAQHAVVREDAARNPPPTYRAATTNERQRDRVDTARLEALRAQQEALAAEAKAHQWEHKQPDPLRYAMQDAKANAGRLAEDVLYGNAQQVRAPGKIFTRSDILAILRAQRAVAGNVADAEYERLLSIFSNIE